MISSKTIVLIGAILTTSFLASALISAPEKKETAAKQPDAQATPQPGQKQFDTPKQAADALVQVATNLDVAAAKEVLGPDGEDIVSSRSRDGQKASDGICKQGKRKNVGRDKQEKSKSGHSDSG